MMLSMKGIRVLGVLAALVLTVGSAAGQAAAPGHTPADVRFMREMIGHHAQALEMAALVPERTDRRDLRLLAERITVSQQDEIAMMQAWLRAHGEEAPAADAHAGHHAHHAAGADSAGMPGMATAEEMARLAAARGAEFDRLFLELMIRHHEGALVMVRELFATPGAGQESQIYSVASEVDADQRMEIDRMRSMLDGPPGGPRPR
jgi:uncharacterized protein (DUF305 family)